LFSVLVLSQFASSFHVEQVFYDFVTASPSPPLRLSYATPVVARDDMSIVIFITGDFGYEFIQGAPKPAGADRNQYLSINLISPSGIVIDLGTYFNNNQIDDAPNVYVNFPPEFYAIELNGGTYQRVAFPNDGDRGYYNVLNKFAFVIPYDIINPITREGGFIIEFSFSAAVNPWFSPYPAFNYFGLNELTITLDYFEGGIIGDPHFFGFDGQLFDFQGEANKIYNAISHKDLQLNLKLKEKEFVSVSSMEELNTLAHNTFIGSIGLQTSDFDVAIHSGSSSTEEEAGYVLINHKMYPIRESGTILEKEGLLIQWANTGSNTLHKSGKVAGGLYVKTPSFDFKVFFLEQGRNLLDLDSWTSHPFRFLEISVNHYTEIGEPMHGILGQTAPKKFVTNEVAKLSELAGHIFKLEGSNSDYEVSHLFGGDFKFNVFERRI